MVKKAGEKDRAVRSWQLASAALIAEVVRTGNRALSLQHCELDRLPDAIRELGWLEGIGLANNSLRGLPDWFVELSKLRLIDLSNNPLRVIPKAISRMQRLEGLELRQCHLSELPAWLRSMERLTLLNVEGNPDLQLPAELVQSHDARRILDYYFRVNAPGARKPLNEFKLVLVGRGGVGKTTLVNRLVTDKYKEFKRTPGISITKWPTIIDGDDVRAHIWDFGGQEIMHGTHRFFMTERALYLILISGREGMEDHDADYWLSLVGSFAGDVPIIVLLHKWSDYRFELNREMLREKYGRNIAFLETDSATGHGIQSLRETICQLAKNLPGLKAAWPSEWRHIKEVLPAKRRSWLTFDDFRAFCRDEGVKEPKDQEALAASLHDLGLMLSYRHEQELREIGVLNPQWVTKGIYEMLNSPMLREAGGKFTVKTFADVLPDKAYPKALHRYLLALMRKFQLCHPLDTKGDKFLIPELLTKEEPKLDAEFPPEKSLGFIYNYGSVLPEGLLPRFIVETYVMREPKLAWRTGVVLERANCRAHVRGDIQGRRVTVRVTGTGSGRRELLGIIREHFERIHKSYEKLLVMELVPIPGYPKATVEHELLLKYERLNREKITVDIGSDLMDFVVKDLLDGVDIPGTLRSVAEYPDGSLKSIWLRKADSIPVYISYAPKDAPFLDQLKSALVPYERTGELSIWADALIEAGQGREDEITRRLDRAQIIVLLLSNNYLSSCERVDNELARAAERHKNGECVILPIIVRSCRFDKLDTIAAIQPILPDGKPVGEHKKRDAAWLKVTKELDRVVRSMRGAGRASD